MRRDTVVNYVFSFFLNEICADVWTGKKTMVAQSSRLVH